MATSQTAIDPITAEIVRNYMESTAAEIVKTMVRTSVNPIFNEAHDCSAGVFYYDGETASIIARADAVPVHIYGALSSVQECLDFFHGDLSQGDIIIVCDPYYGGTHLGDYTVVVPVFYEGQPVFFPAVRAHTLDQGGAIPGGFNVAAREVFHEGFRFSPMKLYEKGELRREVWDMVLTNNRLPDILEADIGAMIGGCRIGEDRIRRLCDKYGVDTVRDSVHWVFDYSEQMFRDEIRRWPDGTYRANSILDTDFTGREDIEIQVALTIEGDDIVIDFEGTSEQSEGIINSVPPNTLSYIYAAFSALCPDIPINSGFFRPLSARLPEGSVVNPRPPAAAAYATICIGCDIGEAVMKACEQFAPERVGTISIDLVISWTYGVDARSNQFFIQYDYHPTATSSGATKGTDGWGAWAAQFCALKLASLEMTEIQYPCLYRAAEYTTDSAAPGQWRGSPGYVCDREPHHGAGALLHQIWVQGLRHPLSGYQGARGGAGNYAVMRPGREDESVVTVIAFEDAGFDGDRYVWFSCGGGGWGDPLDRDPAKVREDVLDEYVSIEGALHDYGVVIDSDTSELDAAATERERARLRQERAANPDWLAYGRQLTLEATGLEERVAADMALSAT
jgi:N-methylhydantoinase B